MDQTRRTFLKSTSTALAGLGLTTVLPLDALADVKKMVSANDKINIAAIGINGMGWSDVHSLLKIPEVNIVALCDVDDNVLNYR